jgi:hypothetical protein
MYQLKSSLLLAIITNLWLSDFTSLNKNTTLIVASSTSVIGLFHFWHGITTSNDNTLKSNQLINLEGIKFADLILLLHVKGSNLDDCIILILLQDRSLVRLILDLLLVHLKSYQVENGNHIGGIVL